MNKEIPEKTEFKTLYKTYTIMSTGAWTPEDEKKLEEECANIEAQARKHATIISLSFVIILVVLALLLMNFLAGKF